MNPNSLDKPHRRTASEAYAQAEVKDRILTARGMRYGGLVLVIYGASQLARPSTWSIYRQRFSFPGNNGVVHSLSLPAVVGFALLVGGPIVAGVGHLLLRRTIRLARANPVTKGVIDGDELIG